MSVFPGKTTRATSDGTRAATRLATVITIVALVAAGCSAGSSTVPAENATPTATATATPSPSPTPDVGALFVAKMEAMSAGSMTVTGNLDIGGTAATLTGRYDSNGADSYSTTTMTYGKTTQTTDEITWAGKTYVRTGNGAWYEKQATDSRGIGSVLSSMVTAQDIGVTTRDGLQVHRLVPAGLAIQPADIGFEGTGTIKLEFLAREDGTPVAMSLTLDLVQTTATASVPVSGTMDFVFVSGASPMVLAPEPVFAMFTSKKGFSYGHPANWDARADANWEGFDGPNLEWVGTRTYPKGKATLTSTTADLVYVLKKELKAKIISNVPATLGGEQARIVTFTFPAPAGFQAYGICVVAFHRSTEVDLMWQSPDGNQQADTETFNKIVASFKFAN